MSPEVRIAIYMTGLVAGQLVLARLSQVLVTQLGLGLGLTLAITIIYALFRLWGHLFLKD